MGIWYQSKNKNYKLSKLNKQNNSTSTTKIQRNNDNIFFVDDLYLQIQKKGNHFKKCPSNLVLADEFYKKKTDILLLCRIRRLQFKPGNIAKNDVVTVKYILEIVTPQCRKSQIDVEMAKTDQHSVQSVKEDAGTENIVEKVLKINIEVVKYKV